MLTDDALFACTGVRVAFTGREGGGSAPPYDALNLGSHVGDDACAVEANRALVLQALGASEAQLVVPNQVHGDVLVDVASADPAAVAAARAGAQAGADALAVEAANVAALLCFADCVPVVVVSPTGRFAVAHAGWRGAVAGIAGKAARRLARLDEAELGAGAAAAYNAYLGPHIHAECFETGPDVRDRFAQRFGEDVAQDARHVDLAAALRCDLADAGLVSQRIVDAGACTACEPDRYFSHRASGGCCGRHGAVAVRLEGQGTWA